MCTVFDVSSVTFSRIKNVSIDLERDDYGKKLPVGCKRFFDAIYDILGGYC